MKKKLITVCIVILTLIAIKAIWTKMAMSEQCSKKTEKRDILWRKNYLLRKVITTPQQLIDEMSGAIGEQFKGEWALYTCSMTAAALANIAKTYPDTQEEAQTAIDKLIQIVLSPELRRYDRMRWNEDPLESLNGTQSHISYLSHLAWMISEYKEIDRGDEYDELYDRLCITMNNRILASPNMNLPTYPGECIYVPDMLVAIVALSNHSRQHGGEFDNTVNRWLEKAKTEWIDEDTGIIASFLKEVDGKVNPNFPVKGSYSALSCFYLTYVDAVFAREQYERLKSVFLQEWPVAGIKEYVDETCWFGLDIDAGPILLNLSPSGTAFAVGCATFFNDDEVRTQLLRTAEIAGTTVSWNGNCHYLLSNFVLVGEAIMLTMKTR